jgi:hypothetical protein
VDKALINLLSDPNVSKEISCALLDLVAFFDKENKPLPDAISQAAKGCALENFSGDLNQPLPGIAL